MLRARTAALVAAATLVAPASASAATMELDRECYVSGQPGTLTLAGFGAGVAVSVSSPELGSTRVMTDAFGAAVVPVSPPPGDDLPAPGSRPIAFTASEVANPAVSARATGRIAPRAFRTAQATQTPKSRRAWTFSGWTPGRPLYAHFRHRGSTRGTHRFGLAVGACGELRRSAPGIVARGPILPGTWTVVVDQRAVYSPRTSPALADETVVFPTFRPRAALGATALTTAAPGGLPRFL